MKKALALTSAVLLLTACNTTPATTDTDMTTGDSLTENTQMMDTITYQSEYGFSMELPKSWEGYTTEDATVEFSGEKIPAVYFKTAEGVDLFALTVFTPAQWEKEQAVDEPKPEKIGETAEYVIGFDHTQDSAGLEGMDLNFDMVKASFKAL